MKKLLILLTVILISCSTDGNIKKEKTDYTINGTYSSLELIEIDDCEYLYGEWGNATVLTHKGNCKFCAERNKNKE